MPRTEIPVDVLLNILDHVDIAGLATICLLNKICCSCSQDVLYRDICVETRRESRVQQTLAQSTHLARKVRSFDSDYCGPDLAKALRNMISLRILGLRYDFEMDILDGCTFKLDSFDCLGLINYGESLPKFLSGQPSLKYMTLPRFFELSMPSPLEATCLPNLTRIDAWFPWLPILIPGRPLSEVYSPGYTPFDHSDDLSFFALST